MSLAKKGTWLWPVKAPLGTPFGQAGPMWSSGHHTGQDFLAPMHTPVYACAEGTVIYAGNTHGPYGIQVKVRHKPGLETWYCHLSAISATAKRGAHVAAGAFLGDSGATGNVTGPHLHLEVRVNGVPVNPMPWLGGAHAKAPARSTPRTTGGGDSPTFHQDPPGDQSGRIKAGPPATGGGVGGGAGGGVQDASLLGSVVDTSSIQAMVLTGLFVLAGFGLVAVGLGSAVRPEVEAAMDQAKNAATQAASVIAAPETGGASLAAGEAAGAAATSKAGAAGASKAGAAGASMKGIPL